MGERRALARAGSRAPRPGPRTSGPGCAGSTSRTGTGALALVAARGGADVTGVDLAPDLIETAKRLADEEGLSSSRSRSGTPRRFPSRDAAFDAVSSAMGLIFAPDHAAVARELARVLRAGRPHRVLRLARGRVLHGASRASYAPQPLPGQGDSTAWGSEDYAEKMLGAASTSASSRAMRPIPAESGEALWELMARLPGPLKVARSVARAGAAGAAAPEFVDFARVAPGRRRHQPPRLPISSSSARGADGYRGAMLRRAIGIVLLAAAALAAAAAGRAASADTAALLARYEPRPRAVPLRLARRARSSRSSPTPISSAWAGTPGGSSAAARRRRRWPTGSTQLQAGHARLHAGRRPRRLLPAPADRADRLRARLDGPGHGLVADRPPVLALLSARRLAEPARVTDASGTCTRATGRKSRSRSAPPAIRSPVAASQHNLGVTRSWSRVRLVSGTHPVVYVALGSHANYFSPGYHGAVGVPHVIPPRFSGVPLPEPDYTSAQVDRAAARRRPSSTSAAARRPGSRSPATGATGATSSSASGRAGLHAFAGRRFASRARHSMRSGGIHCSSFGAGRPMTDTDVSRRFQPLESARAPPHTRRVGRGRCDHRRRRVVSRRVRCRRRVRAQRERRDDAAVARRPDRRGDQRRPGAATASALRSPAPLRAAAAPTRSTWPGTATSRTTPPTARRPWKRLAHYYPSRGITAAGRSARRCSGTRPTWMRRAVHVWLTSPEHRAILLTASFREIGVSAVHATAAAGSFQRRRGHARHRGLRRPLPLSRAPRSHPTLKSGMPRR